MRPGGSLKIMLKTYNIFIHQTRRGDIIVRSEESLTLKRGVSLTKAELRYKDDVMAYPHQIGADLRWLGQLSRGMCTVPETIEDFIIIIIIIIIIICDYCVLNLGETHIIRSFSLGHELLFCHDAEERNNSERRCRDSV